MNIFYLDRDVSKCAEYHNDKHVVKMILEYAQLLSTAHRVIDGEQYLDKTANGRSIKRWRMEDNTLETVLYKATHINHPSAIWVRQSNNNYNWLVCLFQSLLAEYTYRYGKIHATDRLVYFLRKPPKNIPVSYLTQPTPAMPDEYKVQGDSLQSYRNYYIGAKKTMAKWKNREIPCWWKDDTQ
jgi:hypothetical protein